MTDYDTTPDDSIHDVKLKADILKLIVGSKSPHTSIMRWVL